MASAFKSPPYLILYRLSLFYFVFGLAYSDNHQANANNSNIVFHLLSSLTPSYSSSSSWLWLPGWNIAYAAAAPATNASLALTVATVSAAATANGAKKIISLLSFLTFMVTSCILIHYYVAPRKREQRSRHTHTSSPPYHDYLYSETINLLSLILR